MRKWLEYGALALLLALAACRKTPVPGPDPIPEPARKPAAFVPYEAVDSVRFERTAFAEWAYSLQEGGTSRMAVNLVLQAQCKDNNDALHLRMKEESGGAQPQWGFWNYILHYRSTDARGEAVTLSERIVFPVGFSFEHRPQGLLLVNHPTIGSDAECPTRAKDYLLGMASLDYVAVFPDLQGFGVSRDRAHPYLCAEQTARNSVDGLLAALHFLYDRGIELRDGAELRNVGYSQGGASALAVHRYLENRASEEIRSLLPLTASYCGGGPYDLGLTMEQYAATEDLAYPCTLPMIVLGMIEGFPELFAGIQAEDYFPEAVIKADVLAWTRDKEHTADRITDRIRAAAGTHRMDGMLSEAMSDPGSPQYKALAAALAANDLTTGWKPVKPVYFCHVPEDEVVPYANLEKAWEAFEGGNIARFEPFTPLGRNHVGGGAGMYMTLLKGFRD